MGTSNFITTMGVHVFVEQNHHTYAPRLGLRPREGNTLQVDTLLSTDETKHLIEMLIRTLPPITAYDLTSRLNRETFMRAERSKKDRRIRKES